MISVFIERPRKSLELSFSGSIAELMRELDINPETVVILKNGALTTSDDELSDGDEVRFASVVSGG